MKTLAIAILHIHIAAAALAQTFSGVATHFEALGDPYGGCGVPTALVDSEHFVALNVFNAPNTGAQDYTRPLTGSDTALMGQFANGMNCGRWVKVTIGADCIDGINDGALNQEFCRGASAKWVDDQYSGAELYMVVTDACGDNNGWCRNSAFHLDLHTSSLNQFVKDGVPVGDMYPLHFHNRQITWEYIKAPHYRGDVEIYFMQGAEYYWPAIMVNNLQNGITAVEQFIDGAWLPAERNSDMGQAFILKPADTFTIRIKDITGRYINWGKEYSFGIPTQCGTKCTGAATLQPDVQTVVPPVEQTVALDQGWNLVSFYVQPVDNAIASVFAGLDVAEIKTMDDFWLKDLNASLNGLKSIAAGQAYLVKMNAPGALKLTGKPILPALSAPAGAGWQLIGCPYPSPEPAAGFFSSNFSLLKSFDGFAVQGGSVNSIHYLEPGKGYFAR